MIRMEDMNFRYDQGDDGVNDLSLNINENEIVVLLGASGSGKTTVTRLINGLAPSFYKGDLTGSLYLNGKDHNGMQMWERSSLVGTVFQDPRSQFFSYVVEGEIAFGCENMGHPSEEIRNRVAKSMDELNIHDLSGKSLDKLSTGEKQKIAVASILAMGPGILVLDEPSSTLDTESTICLRDIISSLKEKGHTIVVAEHRLWYLADIADRFIFMDKGRVTDSLTREEIATLPDQEIERLGLRKLIYGSPQLKNPSQEGSVVMSVNGLSHFYGKNKVIENMDLEIRKGEILAITGKNGAGKTTLARILSGFLKPKKGRIHIDDKEASKRDRMKRVRFIPHDTLTQLFGESVIGEMLLMFDKTDENIERAKSILTELGLIDLKDRHPATLSGGQKQRLVIGVAMMEDVDIVILDEPTSGLDKRNMMSISKALRKASEYGRTIIVITHDNEFIEETCTRIFNITDNNNMT